MFESTPDETEGRLIYELGNHQWKIPKLRMLLEEILLRNSFFNNFEVTHDFPHLGRRTMLLNARRLEMANGPSLILLAIEDVTEPRKATEEALARRNVEFHGQAEELTRFNQAAVGRELRMIELKKEINELCEQHGEPVRYPLEFEQGGTGHDDTDPA